MLARKCKVIRMQKGISMEILSKEIGYSRDKIQTYENIRTKKTDDSMIQKIADYFNTTVEDIEKVYEVEVSKDTKHSKVEIIRENVAKEEVFGYLDYKIKKQMEMAKVRNNKKQSYIRTKAARIKSSDKYKTSSCNRKPFKCLNQACPLNKNCMCDNPVVIRGDAPCYGKDLVKDKPKKQDMRNTRACFMADKVSKHERGEIN